MIRVDANIIKLATSSANALLGTAINLTTNGTGTQVLEVGIPYVRARTYVPRAVDVAGAQVKSADLNALMDAWKAFHRFVTGQAQAVWTGLKLAANQHVEVSGTGRFKHGLMTLVIPGSAFESANSGMGYGHGGAGISNSGGSAPSFYAPIILPIGARILACRLLVRDNVTGTTLVAAQLNRYTASTDTNSNVSTSANSAGTGALQTLATAAVTEVITTGITHQLVCLAQSGTNAVTVHGGEVDYDMP